MDPAAGAWESLGLFFVNFYAPLRADALEVCPDEAAALADLKAAAERRDAAAAGAAAGKLLEATTALLGRWEHVCWRELHVAALLAKATALLSRGGADAPPAEGADAQEAMRCADMAVIFGAPAPCHEGVSAAAEARCHAGYALPPGPVADFAFPSDLPDVPPGPLTLGTSPLGGGAAVATLREPLSAAEFKAKFYKTETPVVLLGAAAGSVAAWPAMERWQRARHFCEAAGWRTVPTEVGCRRRGAEREGWAWREEAATLGGFMAGRIAGRAAGDPPAYLAQHELLEQLPVLAAEVGFPDVLAAVADEESCTRNCWIGTADTITELHKDSYENLFVQVAGFKYIRLYAPKHAPRLYVAQRGTRGAAAQGNCSQLRCEEEDFEAHPKAEGVEYFEAILPPGGAMYIPEGWFHYLRALTPSVSVNHWF